MQSWNIYFLCFLFEFKKLETYSSALKSPLLRIDAETSLNVNFFQPDSTFIVYAGVGRKSLQRHPGQTFVWQIALVGTTIAIDGRVGWKKKKREGKRKMTLKIKKAGICARDIGHRCCVRLFMTKGTRNNATTRINRPFVAASSNTASRVAFNATSIPNCGRQRGPTCGPLEWLRLNFD